MTSDKHTPPNGRSPVLSAPGLILVGPTPKQIAYNLEAVQILAYPNLPPAGVKRVGTLLTQQLAVLLKQRSGTEDEIAVTEIISGQRRYRCTRYVLNMQGLPAATTMGILLERMGSPDVTVQELCNGLHLTGREREVVGFLVRGLTGKEVAQRMGISPNTVKSFVRLVMTKAGVSTRAGLVGRVAGIAPRPPDMAGAASQSRNADAAGFSRSMLRVG